MLVNVDLEEKIYLRKGPLLFERILEGLILEIMYYQTVSHNIQLGGYNMKTQTLSGPGPRPSIVGVWAQAQS